MKPPEHTIPAPIGPSLREISRWHDHLRELHARLRPHFARPEAHQHALRYLQAILSDLPRKNGWQIAEQAREARPFGIQRLLSAAVWVRPATDGILAWPGPAFTVRVTVGFVQESFRRSQL